MWDVQCNWDKRTKQCLSQNDECWTHVGFISWFFFFHRVLAPVECADPLQLFLCLPPPPGQAEDTTAAETERDQSDCLQWGLQLSIVNAGPQYVYSILRLFEFTYLSYCCCSCQVSCRVGEHLVLMPGSQVHLKLCNIFLFTCLKIVYTLHEPKFLHNPTFKGWKCYLQCVSGNIIMLFIWWQRSFLTVWHLVAKMTNYVFWFIILCIQIHPANPFSTT